MPVLLAMPILVAPCVAVPVKAPPLKGMAVAGSDTAAKGKELITTTKTTKAIKGTSSKTVTKTASKAASSAAKPPSAPASSASKAPPSKPASSAAAKSTTSKASKKSSSSSAAAAKTSAAVVVSRTVVSASTSCSKNSAAAASKASSDKTTTSQKAAKAKAITAPTPPLPGMQTIYPKHHTCLHVIPRTKVWESGTASANVIAKTFYVPCVITVSELIEQLTGREGDKCSGWALTEVQETGDGGFVKGCSVVYGDEKAGEAVRGLGWSEKNGGQRPPVWVVLHKV